MGSLFDTPQNTPQNKGPQENGGDHGGSAEHPRKSIFDSQWSSSTEEPDQIINRRVSVWAIIIFLLGLSSLLAFVFDTLNFLPIVTLGLGAVVSLWLFRFHSETGGGKLLLAGICLAICVWVSLFTAEKLYLRNTVAQGKAYAQRVFDFILSGGTLQFQLAKKASFAREEVKDEVQYWNDLLRDDPSSTNPFSTEHQELHKESISNPTVLSLYNYRDSVKITFIEALERVSDEASRTETIPLIYAATYNNAEGQKETFFFAVTLTHYLSSEGRSYWAWTHFPDKPITPSAKAARRLSIDLPAAD